MVSGRESRITRVDNLCRSWAACSCRAVDVLDEAVDSAVLTGLLALQEARTASDPSTAAELCLSAVPHIALAVTLASADPTESR